MNLPLGYRYAATYAGIRAAERDDRRPRASTTSEGIEKVRSAAEEICPTLSRSKATRSWAGLRPVTPDMLPMLGPDPEHQSLIYACGHSRNGVLMAPLTGDLIADLVTGTPLSFDLAQFRPDRF